MDSIRGQLTVRGVVIGAIGCVIITLASAYTALKMGALPWPIVFAAIISLFFLKALGKSTLNEANVTHTIMSAGAMVAGGLAFTIPGIWILGTGEVDLVQMAAVALAGVLMGLVCTAVLRRHFVEQAELEFPIGEAAAQTLKAGDAGGKVGVKLFGAMGLAGVYTALRDGLGLVPKLIGQTTAIPGVMFAIYNSPMMFSVGFLVAGGAMLAWFIGAVVGQFGLISVASVFGVWDIATGQGIASSVGMGIMMGCGIAVIVKDIIPKAVSLIRKRSHNAAANSQSKSHEAEESQSQSQEAAHSQSQPAASKRTFKVSAGLAACAVAAAFLIMCFLLHLDPVASIVIVLLSWITSAMAAQSVGQTGIDPMEIFGLIVLLAVAAFSNMPQVQLFFVAGIISVACGIAGDVMNDFHAGHVLQTSPKAQFIGQAIGGIIGAFVAAGVLFVLGSAYGPEAFGPGAEFVAAQASVVANMISGAVMMTPFIIGLVLGFVLYLLKLPSMMVGLGVYLPFYMSITACLGAGLKWLLDHIFARRDAALPEEEKLAKREARNDTGVVIASGVLGGESVVGVIVALIATIGSFVA